MKINLLKLSIVALLTLISANTYCSDITENTIKYCRDSKDKDISRWNGTIEAMNSYYESIIFLFDYSTNSIK